MVPWPDRAYVITQRCQQSQCLIFFADGLKHLATCAAIDCEIYCRCDTAYCCEKTTGKEKFRLVVNRRYPYLRTLSHVRIHVRAALLLITLSYLRVQYQLQLLARVLVLYLFFSWKQQVNYRKYQKTEPNGRRSTSTLSNSVRTSAD